VSRNGPPGDPAGARTSGTQPQARADGTNEKQVGNPNHSPESPVPGWESKALLQAEMDPETDIEEVDAEELREFLAADVLEVSADPVFKERLREKLWRIVSEQYGTPEANPAKMGVRRRSGTRKDEDS
jgi:hypothetical protein